MLKAPIESFWDTLRLGIQPFSCSIVQCRRIVILATPNDRGLNLMPKAAIEGFWDAMWLGIQSFLCSIVQCRRIVIWRPQTIED